MSPKTKKPPNLSEVMAYLGQRGGRARAKNMTREQLAAGMERARKTRWDGVSPAERQKIARKAARARWSKRKGKKTRKARST